MPSLFSIFPDADKLLALRPEEVAPILLQLALPQIQSAGFVPDAVTQVTGVDASEGRDYPFHKKAQVDTLINRSWVLAERVGLIEPAPGINGRNGWQVFTESGEAVARGQDLARLLVAADFPKELLHPAIREKSWRAIVNSSNAGAEDELTDAVRSAFAVLEEAVRTAGGFTRSDSGAPLMRDAFNADRGPLRDRDSARPLPEREALGHLFAGAYARFRHTVAHGTPQIGLTNAQDQLLLASHLLRIVDAQR